MVIFHSYVSLPEGIHDFADSTSPNPLFSPTWTTWRTLVGGFNPSEKYEFVSFATLFPTEWKVIKFHGSSHHQPVYIYIYHISHQISLLWLAINPIYYGKSTSSLLIEVSWKNSAGVFWSPRCIVLGISGMRLRVRGWGEALKWMEMMGIWMVSGPCLIIKCNQIPGWWLILVNSGIIVA